MPGSKTSNNFDNLYTASVEMPHSIHNIHQNILAWLGFCIILYLVYCYTSPIIWDKIKEELIKTQSWFMLENRQELHVSSMDFTYLSIRITTVNAADFFIAIQRSWDNLYSGEPTQENNNITTRCICLWKP